MARTAAERARDYRARKREARGIVPMMPAADHEAFKAKVRMLAEQDRAEIERLTDALEAAREQAAGRSVPPCRVCGGALGCPQCSRAGGWEDDFG